MMEKDAKELGIKCLQTSVVVVRSKLEGGQRNEVMPIGHDKTSKTFMPQIAADLGYPVLAYCDCPGFFDNRGPEINIANAVNIKLALQEAKCVKVLILISFKSLEADRGRGLADMLNICLQLFGSKANLERFKDALLLGVTQAPKEQDLNALREWLIAGTDEVFKVFSKRLFLYDPLNRGGSDFWLQYQCATKIAELMGIPQSRSKTMFQTVLTADDLQKLEEIVTLQSNMLLKELNCGDYGKAGSCWQVLQKLRVIENTYVEQKLRSVQQRLRTVIADDCARFRGYAETYEFEKAKEQLAALRDMISHFDEDLDLNMIELERYYDHCQTRQATEEKVAAELEQWRRKDILERCARFFKYASTYEFEKAKEELDALCNLVSHFDEEDLDFKMSELERYYELCQSKMTAEMEEEAKKIEKRIKRRMELLQVAGWGVGIMIGSGCNIM